MADQVINRSKGRTAEFAERVNANDPTNAAFILLVLAQAGIESDATLIDKDDVADLVSGTTNEVTNTNYARKTIDDGGGVTITYDDTNDRVDVDMPDQTFTNIEAGDDWQDAVIAYDSDTTAGTDANIIPCVLLDFVLSTDGSDISIQFGADGFFRAA